LTSKSYISVDDSVVKVFLATLSFFGLVIFSRAQIPPPIQWQKDFGGSAADDIYSLQQTADGGYILAGVTSSGISGSKTITNNGPTDAWLIRLDGNGNELWEKSYGGTNGDACLSIQKTSDGGYVLGGGSTSGASGNKSSTNYGSLDCWVVRLDANFNKLWDNSFGGSSLDIDLSVQQNTNGGYILGGYSYSGVSGNKTTAVFGSGLPDFWAVCVDSNGNKLWEGDFGGTGSDTLYTAITTRDGGYLLGGDSSSGVSGNKTNVNFGATDFWLVKIDANGNKIWDKAFGGDGSETVNEIQQTSDNGFILVGSSTSGVSGNKTTPGYGGEDSWVIRLDATGNIVWQKSFGGDDTDWASSVCQTSDGGFIVGNYSTSGVSGTKTSPNYGSSDMWIIRLDSAGNEIWESSFGGSGSDGVTDIQQTSDGGFVIGGITLSGVGGNKTVPNFGSDDYWVIKLAPERPTLSANLTKTNVVLSWPDWKLGFHLEDSASLTASSWSATSGATSTNSGIIFLTVAATNQSKFFRLAK